ncbi:MerR family transcriptional regulator [Paenibacillus ginsengarvi]|uniref:MerR family transcriptional regulator n=1 Tax=Paenibacillus ginsengarvi TaxID=400777 RepID=A0A3B0C012_9BACL|nr:MerR family transcriptional regulator [Paenibacillus ginsengarvi]RKN79123.1 MerR family transcriptional regulator [Paenibacillus ginsengarvi]
MSDYKRGQIAKLAGVNSETLRYYENEGLLPPPARTDSGYRLYTEEALARLTFIKNAKSCGFTLKEIKKALTSSGGGNIGLGDFLQAIDRKIGALDQEIAKREQTKSLLAALRANIQATEKHPDIRDTLRTLRIDS